MKGAEAIGEAAIRAGASAYFCYPITPQTEVAEYLAKRMPQVGGVFLQGESEVAVANMLFGAAATGKRVFTSTSSPGFSLMAEAMSYIAGAELPVVFINVMRCGPGLGGVLAAQGDYWQATRNSGHGDYRCPVLAPCSVQEAAELTVQAFDLAEKYRNPVILLADGMIGQMMEPVSLDSLTPGVPSEKPWATTGCRGRDPNIIKSLYLDPHVLEKMNLRLSAKYRRMVDEEVQVELYNQRDRLDLLVVAYGTMARICKTAIDILGEEGLHLALVRPISLFPFPAAAVHAAARHATRVVTVELSQGQMVEDVDLALRELGPSEFFGRSGGVVPTPDEVAGAFRRLAKGACQ
ncbi:MAG: 3-methyl-2-oxobutanoate dehydrogenase subunit VorB [Candidatus Wallbacteria bacterium]|nr:3-methyl-2-oxobutanoate dehydrogenase subunit VorB [Candidatus Wallbacteria bacterium]